MEMCRGDYAFFVLDLFQSDFAGTGRISWKQNDMYDQEAALAYRAMFVLSLLENRNNPVFKAFEKRVVERARIPLFARPIDVNYILSCKN